MLLAIADAARIDALRHDLEDLDVGGWSVLPVLEGHGRTGVHAGDRVHPGGLVVVFAVVEDIEAHPLLDALARRRDASGDPVTRFFLLPVERQA